MERNDKIKKILGIAIISSIILFNAVVIFRQHKTPIIRN